MLHRNPTEHLLALLQISTEWLPPPHVVLSTHSTQRMMFTCNRPTLTPCQSQSPNLLPDILWDVEVMDCNKSHISLVLPSPRHPISSTLPVDASAPEDGSSPCMVHGNNSARPCTSSENGSPGNVYTLRRSPKAAPHQLEPTQLPRPPCRYDIPPGGLPGDMASPSL